MSTFSVQQRNLDLLKAAQLMLKHGIKPEGDLLAVMPSQNAHSSEQDARLRERQLSACKNQDDIALLLGESIAELRKHEMGIKKLENRISWRRDHVEALKEDIALLRQRLGLSASPTHGSQVASAACNPSDLPDRHRTPDQEG